MRKGLFGVVVLAVLMCFTGVNANAQGKVDLFVGYSYLLDNTSVNGCTNFNCLDPGRHGYNVAAAWNFNPKIALEANLSANHGSTNVFSALGGGTTEVDTRKSDTVTILFGPRLTHPIGMTNFSIYTHLLVGMMHQHEIFASTCCSTGETSTNSVDFNGNGFGMKLGGGLDWNHGRWGIRILELNYLQGDGNGRLRGDFGPTTAVVVNGVAHDFQMATGFKFNFGMTK